MWHRHQKVVHENKLPQMMPVCDSSNEMLFMKISYHASLILVPKWYPWKLAAFITWYMYNNVLKFNEEKLHCIYWLYDIATLWYLYRTMNRCKITYFHGKYYDTYIIHWRHRLRIRRKRIRSLGSTSMTGGSCD